MKTPILYAAICLFCACSNADKPVQADAQDSVEHAEDKQVEDILKNEDSLMKAKEKELLETYGR